MPMRVLFNVPFQTGREAAYLTDVMASGRFAGNGPFTQRAQAWLEERFDIPHVLLTTSCTAALELAVLLHDLGPGDEVLVPSYTFASTASAVHRAGATPVFCELDPATFTIDVEDARSRVTERTKAIIPIHYAGISCDMDAVMVLAQAHDLIVIEDAAQGVDAAWDGKWLGTMGSLGCYSFHETKNLHAGGLGGALCINDPELYDRAVMMWERGTNRQQVLKGLVDKYSWVEPGSSFYPSELQAAYLLAQLESMEESRDERAAVTAHYEAALAPLVAAGKLAVLAVDERVRINHHAYCIVLDSPEQCDAMREHLVAAGVMAYIGYVPLHSSAMGQRLGNAVESLPTTNEYALRILRLPFHNSLTATELAHVTDAIAAFFAGRKVTPLPDPTPPEAGAWSAEDAHGAPAPRLPETSDRVAAWQRLQPVHAAQVAALADGDLPQHRAEVQFESLRDWSLMHHQDEVEAWFMHRRETNTMDVTDIPLKETEGWSIDPETGDVAHHSGEFFRVHGLRIRSTAGREVGGGGWDQPILTQVGYDGGLLGILRQRFHGIPHYLIEAKAEPGNYEKLQLSPTLQATFSNLKRAHAGRKPHFAEYFEAPSDNEGTVLYDQWMSEDGGRLHLKRNKGMLVEVPEGRPISLPDGFIWLSMFQIKALLQHDAWVNPHIRGIISHI